MSTVYLQPRNPVENLKKLDFPYTPQIEYGQEVKYDSYGMSHTNYQTYGYGRTENPSINLTCKFSAHTSEHFNLSAYALRFLRTYTKMNYGRTDPQRGLPPRILRFFAYGNQVFDNVPVVISKFNMTFPEDIDYVKGKIDPNSDIYKDIESVRKNNVPTNATPEGELPDIVITGSREREIYLPVFFTISIRLLETSTRSPTFAKVNQSVPTRVSSEVRIEHRE
jgi:hypothetical protein